MRIPLTVMIIAIAMLASPHAYGQAGKGQIGTIDKAEADSAETASATPGCPPSDSTVPAPANV